MFPPLEALLAAPPDRLDAAGIVDSAERSRLDGLLGADHELPALIHALDGGFTRPAPGGARAHGHGGAGRRVLSP